jgi:hypothetical protein
MHLRHQCSAIGGCGLLDTGVAFSLVSQWKEETMYYLRTVIEKLTTPDGEVRRARRHHDVQRAARVRRSQGKG